MKSLHELFEIKLDEQDDERRTRTRTRTKTDDPDLSAFERGMRDEKQLPGKKQRKTRQGLPRLKQASASQTHRATANLEPPASAAEKMSFLQRLGLEDMEVSDEEAAVTWGARPNLLPQDQLRLTGPTDIDNMPAVINKEIAKHAPVNPDWHQVKHLPGYLQSAIRAMGRQIFSTFTKTRIENIQVIADVGGQGPNSRREINAVAGWLRDKTTPDTDGEMNFQRSLPEYDVDFHMYSADGFTFMLVNDEYGVYIYSWPTADNKY